MLRNLMLLLLCRRRPNIYVDDYGSNAVSAYRMTGPDSIAAIGTYPTGNVPVDGSPQPRSDRGPNSKYLQDYARSNKCFANSYGF